MKIKILKDIPGFKAGEVHEYQSNEDVLVYSPGYAKDESGNKFNLIKYPFEIILSHGFAEEVKEEIDVEVIRTHFNSCKLYMAHQTGVGCPKPEAEWFTAYRIVKAVIEKLNGDWLNPISIPFNGTFYIFYNRDEKIFMSDYWNAYVPTIFPGLKDKKSCKKVIELCEPELKILFGV